MRWTAFSVIVGGCLLLAGCGGDGGSPAPVAGGAPAPGASPGMPGDGASPEGTPPSDGYTPPNDGGAPSSDGGQGTQPGDNYIPPSDGPSGTYDGGANSPGYNPDGTPMSPLRPRVKSLREQAIDAFRAGNEKEAFRLLQTHLAISPTAQADVAEKMAWVPGLRRPAVGPRIGIAAHYTKPVGDFAQSPQPIGSQELKQALAAVAQSSGRGGQRGGEESGAVGGFSGDPAAGADGAQAAAKQLEFYAGDFGTKFLDLLKAKVESGEYGAMYKELAEEVARPAPTFDPNNPGDPNLASGGNPGDGFVDPGTGIPAASGLAGAGPARLGLAITWLGKFDKEKRADLTKAVQDLGIDLLVTYDIDLSQARVGNLIVNKTRMRITDVKRNEALFTSSELDSRTVVQGREKGGSEEDPVEKQVTRAIAELDKACKPTELPPTVTAERAKARIAGLIAEKPADPLPVLLETRFYVAKGLLTESEMQSTAVSLLGEIEYAQLIASSPDGAMMRAVGSAVSLPGMIDLVRGVNGATGASARAKARKLREEANPGEGQPAKARGWRDFLPVGGGQKK